MDTVEEVLAHYGVKGMRWGVRRARNPKTGRVSGSPEPVTVKTKGGKIKTSGGRSQPVSEDAKFAAAALQKAKASGASSLSNKEMQAVVNRMNLEQNYSKVVAKSKQSKGGKAFAKELLFDIPKEESKSWLRSEVTKQVGLAIAAGTVTKGKHRK